MSDVYLQRRGESHEYLRLLTDKTSYKFCLVILLHLPFSSYIRTLIKVSGITISDKYQFMEKEI